MNLRQICRAVISAFVLLQELTRRAEILVHLHLPSAFLAIRLGVYRLTAYKQISLSPPLPKGRGRGIQIHAPHPGRLRFDAEQHMNNIPKKNPNF
ncbi:MAG: hypothetical protein CMH30_09640 [Micavibrio sp.]|nr:hypothetical protein [Micavibrio sp.]